MITRECQFQGLIDELDGLDDLELAPFKILNYQSNAHSWLKT